MRMKKNIHVVAARKNQKNKKIMLGFFVIYFWFNWVVGEVLNRNKQYIN